MSFKFVDRAIKRLKRQYGQSLTITQGGTHDVDPDTGDETLDSPTITVISKVLALDTAMTRRYFRDLEVNMYDLMIAIDPADIPVEIQKDDKALYDGATYIISRIHKYPGLSLFICGLRYVT